MRTTIDLPDGLYRQIKARAAMEGRPVKALVHMLLQRGLAAPESAPQSPAAGRSLPPTVSVGHTLPMHCLSNAGLFEVLDEASGGAE